jgi:Raf kinase inhibitor-like YbhB/YbcL family protein
MRIWPFAALLALACASPALALSVSSRDLVPGAAIPTPHIYPRCGGENVSPDLSWSGAPDGTRSFVLTMVDMDVKPAFWSHWVVADLPPSAEGITRGAKALPSPARAVVSNFGDAAYAGPCPPPGSGLHHYTFTIWAMPEASTTLPADQPADALIGALAKTALAHGSLTAAAMAKP